MAQLMAHHLTHDVVTCLDDVPVKGQLPPLAAQPAPQPPALWGQLVAMPSANPAIASRVAQPAAASQAPLPLWLALQPYANARLWLFDVARKP